MNKEPICYARINFELSKLLKILFVVYYIMVVIMFYKTGPAKNDDKYQDDFSESYSVTHYEHQYIWGKLYHSEVVKERSEKVHDNVYMSRDNKTDETYDIKALMTGIIYTILLVIVPVILIMYIKKVFGQSSLILYEDKISGRKKNFLVDEAFDIPIEKIKDIRVKRGLFNNFGNGYIIDIKTDVNEYMLDFVQNATIFAEETNNVLKKK